MSPPSLSTVLARGFVGRCPACGEGRLYTRYLKVAPACAACGHELGQYRADDGPAYFTILIVGHLVVGPTLFFPFVWRAPAAVALAATLIPLIGLTLLLLPRIKGAFIGLLLHLRLKREQAPGSELDASEIGSA